MKLPLIHRQQASFTLIELLLVIVLIGLLAALVLRAANYVRNRSAIAQCKAELAMFANALEEYFRITGSYPMHNSEANCNSRALDAFYNALVTENVVKIEWRPERISNMRFLDPWGTPYCYHKHIDYRPNTVLGRMRCFILKSAGPDRLWDTIDDITDEQSAAN